MKLGYKAYRLLILSLRIWKKKAESRLFAFCKVIFYIYLASRAFYLYIYSCLFIATLTHKKFLPHLELCQVYGVSFFK